MLKCISAPEAADQLTRGDFSRRFSAKGRMKGQDSMTSNVACHAMLWTENSNKQTKT